MRDLKECRAEVFRRSEKRISERKQRRKMVLMVCIPAVLCVSVLSAFALLPGERSGEVPENMNLQYACGTEAAGSVNGSAGSVEVSGNGRFLSHTSAQKVQAIVEIIDGVVDVADGYRGGSGIRDEATEETGSKQNYMGKGYQIRILHSDGSEREYLLENRVLVDLETEERYPMEKETYLALKEALGVPLS